jgi:hypothetical protein
LSAWREVSCSLHPPRNHASESQTFVSIQITLFGYEMGVEVFSKGIGNTRCFGSSFALPEPSSSF